jgi:hypothetical protein
MTPRRLTFILGEADRASEPPIAQGEDAEDSNG